MMTLGQLWSNSITQNDTDTSANVKPVTTNESVVNQNNDEKAYHNYKKGVLDKVINGGKLNNESETSE